MRCIQCGHTKDRVIDSRVNKEGTSIRRRRVCEGCGYRYTTYEVIEHNELQVVKKDSKREGLRREKILNGLIKACEKRPVSRGQLEQAVDEIINQIHKNHRKEVSVQKLGMAVMDKLHQMDLVAYIRYVSVYREFENVTEFIEEIQTLENKARRVSHTSTVSNKAI